MVGASVPDPLDDVPDYVPLFGENLRNLREGQRPRMSQGKLSRLLGQGDRRYVAALESGSRAPTLTEMVRLVRIFDLRSIEELLGPLPALEIADHFVRLGTFPSRRT